MSESWQIVEALLFATPEVVSSRRLSDVVDMTPSEIEACIDRLNREYAEQGRAFHIRQVAGGWQMVTLPRFAVWIGRLLSKRGRERLSKAALETLAVIAHRQPVNKPDIDQARGIDSSYILSTLLERGLIRIKGRDKRAGHPYVYVTTPRFLEFFGLNTLSDLPDLEEPSVNEADIMPLEESEAESAIEHPLTGRTESNERVSEEALAAIGYRIESKKETRSITEEPSQGEKDEES